VYSMWVSFVELYNEKCYDLLDSIPSKFKGKRKVLKVISDKSGHSFIKGTTLDRLEDSTSVRFLFLTLFM